jgi:hypothetical protein
VLREIKDFLYNGEVVDQCFDQSDAAVECDCATGACD